MKSVQVFQVMLSESQVIIKSTSIQQEQAIFLFVAINFMRQLG